MNMYIELTELQKFCRKYTEYDAVRLILADRTDLLHVIPAIPLEKIKQAREEIDGMSKYVSVTGDTQYKQLNRDDVLEIFDKLVESEEYYQEQQESEISYE